MASAPWAFSDESQRSDRMLLAMVLVAPADIPSVRLEAQRLLLPGQRRLHMSDESDRRRRQILGTTARLDHLTATVFVHRPQAGTRSPQRRQNLIAAATDLLVRRGVTSWTLDDVPPADRARDRRTISHRLSTATRSMVFDHRANRSEPLLWIADAICWAAGAGGSWRRHIDAVTTVVEVTS